MSEQPAVYWMRHFPSVVYGPLVLPERYASEDPAHRAVYTAALDGWSCWQCDALFVGPAVQDRDELWRVGFSRALTYCSVDCAEHEPNYL